MRFLPQRAERIFGSFEIKNVTKSLPLKYRMIDQTCVTSSSDLDARCEMLVKANPLS